MRILLIEDDRMIGRGLTEALGREVSRVHGRVFGSTLPANTLLEVSRLVGGYEVEIEAEAIVE